MNNDTNNQKLNKKEEYLLKKQTKEQERLKKARRNKIKKIVSISLPLILIAGGIVFAVLNYSPSEKLPFKQAVGKQAPDFNLENIDGKTIKLSDYRGKNVILFFNEGEMCYPACWDQIAELGKDERFNTNDVVAFSLVVDQKSAWEKIVKETPGFSNARILFDTTKDVSRAYDVLSLNSSMHQGQMPGHTYFIIDKEGIIRYAFDDPNMAIRNDMLISELSKLEESQNDASSEKPKITVFYSPTCSCCQEYLPYLRRNGFNVEEEPSRDMLSIKEKYQIPPEMESCHTSVIGDYFIEGHMPVEVIKRLLEEKPEIDGIALPGMPQGSPGMPGLKIGKWTIYGFSGGTPSEFMIY